MTATANPDSHALARRRILTAMDEIVAQFVFHAECLQRFDTAAPTLIAGHVADRISAVALALTQYQAGQYEVAATLAAIPWPPSSIQTHEEYER